MDNKSKLQQEYQLKRKKRVQRMKRNIIIFVAILLLIPTVICIFLAIRVGSLQRQIDYLYEAKFGDRRNVTDESDIRLADGELDYTIVDIGTDGIERAISENELTIDPTAVKKKVYLTFDDGPSRYTDVVLDVLRRYDVKATFFVIGREDEELTPYYKRIVDEGHTIAMHSYSHQYSEIYNDLESFKADFYKIRDYIEDNAGVVTNLYRFPGGSGNKVSNMDMKEFIKFLNSEGVTYFDWNAANGDATSTTYTISELVQNVLKGIGTKTETVVLMHDTNTKGTTVESLPILIEALQKQGIDIVPIDESTKPVQQISAESVKN